MNPSFSNSDTGHLSPFDPATSLSSSRLREATLDKPDYWTALLSASLVGCMLMAMAICTWSVSDWNGTKSIDAQPAVATTCVPSVRQQHTF